MLASRSLRGSFKMSDGGANFREVLIQQIIVPPFIPIVSIDPACEICRRTDRHDEADQFTSRRVDQHSFYDGRFAPASGSRNRFLSARRCSVVDCLDDALVDFAEWLAKLLEHVGPEKQLRICKTSQAA